MTFFLLNIYIFLLIFYTFLCIFIHMDISEYIKLCCVKRGDISVAELARLSGQSSQNLSNKIARNNFKFSELEKIAQSLKCHIELKFIDDETNLPLI